MSFQRFFAPIFCLAALSIQSFAQEAIADVLADPALDINRPADRAIAVQRMEAIERANLERARLKAQAEGIPMRRVLPDGTVMEIMGLDENGDFLINTTRNANAAISSAANLVYSSPYTLDGSGVTVGVWDESAVRVAHQEFQTGSGSRVTVRDGATTLSSHATHVAGTVGAAGVTATAKGMAPNVWVDSYNWTSDDSEMTGAGATAPAQAGKLTISNHSYGFGVGWQWNGSNWQWYGTNTDQTGYGSQFGQYSAKARTWDTISFNAPYYLIFHSAGNDNSNNPANGNTVVISGNLVTYDNTKHPPGNGLYRNTTTNSTNGYENIGHQGNSKNIMTIGAANDAVTSGQRDPAKSTLTAFSSRGPTDDGRIKPDIVANGALLYSTDNDPNNPSNDAFYSSKSGTSMSSPSAAGSAALLVELYRSLFSGGDMRASTLKGLILHTATDIGNPGPDYHFGWGLMDSKSAADLIIDHHANPSKNRMIEAQLTTAVPSQTYTFTWDGSSPIRATLNWTDPAASSTTAHDSRDSRLINDLDLKLVAPDGTKHYPFVMPFVGTWSVASMSAHATTGINSTDNVEQVLIANPGQAGQWTVEITHKGNLTNNNQYYSLLTSGLSAAPLSMAVARGDSSISVGGADGVSGTAVGSGTQLTYTISNVGGGQLELTTPVTISGQQNCSVTVNTQPATLVNGGGSTNLVATVTPAADGTWSFNISIANNDPDKNPYHWLVTGIAGSSGSVSFTPVADTYIDSLNAGSTYGSATDIRLNNQTGGNPNNRLYMRGLVRFDLSSIPAGTTIESATLDFVQNNTVSGSINIYDATGTWTEAGATWNNSNTLFGSTIYGTANLPGTAGGAVPGISLNASGLSKVQSWVNTPSGNHGFGVTATDSGNSQNWMSLRSREHATSAHHPKLTVTYGGGGSAGAPLMIVSGNDGAISNGGTDSIPETQTNVGTQLTYSVANLGSANLTLTTPVTATAVSNCSITVNTQPSSPVAPSGSTNLLLTITPSSAGAWSATVSVANNDADKNPYTWTLSGSAFGSHTVTYNGNNNDSGTAPVDANNPYLEGSTVTVLGNIGGLTKTGFTFAGWNTTANGSGTTYAPGDTFAMPGSDVTLHALWNALPVVNAGPDQTIFLTASSWTPLKLNPGLWLDAADSQTITLNGGSVSQWADKSEFNRHATQGTAASQPAYSATGLNGKGILTFDGGDDLFAVDLDFLAGASHSAFIVTKPTIYSNIYGAANGNQSANSLHVGFNGSNYRMNYWGNDFGPVRTNFVANEANIVNYIWTTGIGKQILANGKSEGSNTNAGDIGTMSGGGRIGRTTGHPFFGGDIAEIIIIPGQVTPEVRQEIEGYLAHKWDLAANLANDHPYKNSPPDGAAASTTLAGSASDPEDDAFTTLWTLEDGPASPSFVDETATDTGVTFTQEGIYTLRLTAADEFGSTSDDVIITVGAPTEERTITYAGNGNTSGTAPVDPQSPYDDAATVTALGAGDLDKIGHTFADWNTSATGNGTPYAPDATFTINANTTLHAQWIPNTYTVTFDPNGGGTPAPETKEVTFNAPYGTLATTSRAGYSFDGWFTGGTEVTEVTTVTTASNHTLFAQWTLIPVSVVTSASTVHVPEGGTETFQVKLSDQPAENVTVTVARSSGDTDISVQSGGSLSFTTANWDTYQTVTLAAAIDADAANGSAIITCTPSDPAYDAAFVTAIEIDKDTLLTVASDGNGTTDPSGTLVVEKGAAAAILANPSVSHNFVNWTVTSGSASLADAGLASTTVTISEPATVQANFAIKQYTLSYSAPTGGSIFGDSPQIVDHGADGTQVTAVAFPGYSFVKWSDDIQTESRTDTAVTADLTVSAEFSANTYTVTFNANGGTATVPASIEVTFDSAYGTLPSTERTGHTFNGWFTETEGGDQVTAETLVAIDADHALHAQWTPDTYTVTYLGNGSTSGTVPENQEKVHDVDLILATNSGNLVKTGFSFDGWNTADDGTGTDYPAAGTYTGNSPLTLYAQWVAGVDGTWLPTIAGPFNWGDTENWSNGIVASGADRTAFFTPNISEAQTVNMDAPRTIGNITFTDSTTSSHDLTISGSSLLTLSRTSGVPIIDVTQSNRTLTISSQVFGNNGLMKSGTGSLVVSGNGSSLSGDIRISGGTLSFATLDAWGGTGKNVTFTGTGTLTSSQVGYNAGTLDINPEAIATITNSTGGVNGDTSIAIGTSTGSGTLVCSTATNRILNIGDAGSFTGILQGRLAGNANLTTAIALRFSGLGDGVGSALQFRGGTSDSNQGYTIAYQGTSALTFQNRQIQILDRAASNWEIRDNILANNSSDPAHAWVIHPDLSYTGGRAGQFSAQTGRNFILSGTNTGNNEFAGIIPDGVVADVPFNVQKSDTGKWILSGNSTYTGTTTVNAGKLFIDGDQSAATGDVSVAANATLGGSGTIGGNTTIANNGRLEFGLNTTSASHNSLDLTATRTLTFSGASALTITTSGGASPGIYTLVTAPGGITGNAPATLNLPPDWVATTEISGNSLLLNVTSTGSGPGPVASFTITEVPSQATVGTEITGITLAALDANEATATSFTGTVTFGGTGGFTGTSANFVGGILSGVSVTPTVAGSDLTLTVDDGAGHTGMVTIATILSVFDDWASASGLTGEDAAPGADPDGDGLTNLQEFAFGTNPTAGASGSIAYEPGGNVTNPGIPVALNIAVGEGVDYRAIFGRRKNHQAAGLSYTVEFSAGLDVWVASVTVPTLLTAENSDGDIDAVSVPYPLFIPVDGGFKKPTFFRVGVSME